MNDAPAVAPRWEYKVVQYVGSLWNSSGEWSQPEFEGWCTEQVLNHLGAEGWELVSLGPVHGETSTPAAAYIMKRRDTKNEL